jgi:anti-anti-sigma regulatory factor
MRRHGLVDSPEHVGLNGHACWGYDDAQGDFRDAAASFLAEGLELGQSLMFVGGPDAEEVARELEPSLQVAPFEAIYPGGRRMANADQWALYAGATDQALADGHTGLRVLAEVTSLASPPDAWREHAVWESYADRHMASRPLAALCCFDRTALSEEALSAIASAHPVVDRRLQKTMPFQLFALGDDIAVTGEVDAFSSETFEALLAAGAPADDVLDLTGLTFIDHTGMRAIVEHSRRLRADGRSLIVRGEPAVYRRLADLLRVGL